MEEYIIEELEKERWKGFHLPVSYTSDHYYDISIQKTDDGFYIPIEKKEFDFHWK